MKRFEKLYDGLHYLKNHALMRISDLRGHIYWKPDAVYVDITGRCACRCKHCDIWKNNKQEELATKHWKSVIEDLHDWLGSYGLIISGGEPFLREDLLDICEHAVNHGVNVNILTNGMHLTEKVVKEVCRIGIQRMAFSVDGLCANHDYVRGTAGLFERIDRTMYSFRRHPQRPIITVVTIVTGKNIGELEEMLDWADSHDLNGILFHPLAQNFGQKSIDENWHEKSEFWVHDYDRLCSAIDRLVELRRHGRRIINSPHQLQLLKEYYKKPFVGPSEGRGCGAGRNSLGIDVRGNVICCYRLGAIGNVLENPISEIWKSNKPVMMHQRIVKCRLNCSRLAWYRNDNIIDKIYRYVKFH